MKDKDLEMFEEKVAELEEFAASSRKLVRSMLVAVFIWIVLAAFTLFDISPVDTPTYESTTPYNARTDKQKMATEINSLKENRIDFSIVTCSRCKCFDL